MCVDAVGALVEDRQGPRLVRRAQHLAGQAELGQQVGLDGPGPVSGGAADVRDRIERVDVAEHDRLHLARALLLASPLHGLQHRLAEAPLHHRVDGGEPLLDEALDARMQLVHAALHRHREERQDLLEPGREQGVEVARIRRGEAQHADELVLVEQRRDYQAAHALAQDRLFLDGARRQRGDVLDEDRLAGQTGSLVDRAGKVPRPPVGGAREDAALGLLELVAGVEHQDPVALEGGQGQVQVRAAE